MASVVDPMVDDAAASVVAGVFVLIAAVAWFASLSGVSIALACYGAALVSGRMHAVWRASTTRWRRCLGLVGLALPWIAALAYSALALPSNYSFTRIAEWLR